jgi:hypothetical protein
MKRAIFVIIKKGAPVFLDQIKGALLIPEFLNQVVSNAIFEGFPDGIPPEFQKRFRKVTFLEPEVIKVMINFILEPFF